MSARKPLPPRQSHLLNPADPDEKFIAEGIAFFFAEGAGRYQMLASRRVELGKPGRRVVVQAVRQRAARRGSGPGWFLMVWDVEGRGVRFLPQRCKAVMWERYRSIGEIELRAVVAS